MTVYLVRHADAKGRTHWDGPDGDRPLSKKGQRQADGLAAQLADADVRHVLSSPAVRCVDTVLPLASGRDVKVEQVDELREGASTQGALRLVQTAAHHDGDTVLCTHGDLVPEVLRALTKDGVRMIDDLRFAKGSTWVLSADGHTLTEARYLPPSDDP
jgi:8-oxo-dGTP diphosphatase